MSLPFVDARAKDTFLDYARRIRSITFIHDASVDVMEWIFAFGSPTFPALTHFIWGARDVANLQLCRPLMTSTLHSFLVKFYCGGKCKEMLAEFNAAVSALVQVASSDLTTFAVQHEDDELPNEESLELTDILVRGLPCAPMLERFIMKDMTLGAAAIAVLSTAPKLRVFEASLADDVQAFAVGSNLFSGLGRLTLHGSILNCTAFISALSSPSRVTVFLVQLADKAISNEAAFDIARNVRLTFGNQLQTLQLRHSTGLPSIIMPPLFECSKLQSVDITIKVEDDEQSSELDEQAWEAWPDLSTLKWR